MRLAWPPNELHAGFFRSTSAFSVVAAEASGDNIVPPLLATQCDGYDVIKCQVFRRKFLTAVLTRVIVSSIDICPRKFHTIVILDPNVLKQPDNGRKFDCKRNGVNLLVVLLNDFHFPGEQQRQRFLPGNDPQRLVGSVQE